MKRNGLSRYYDRLTPEERFRLDVEAMARGDETESRRLVDSCPRRDYVMTDIVFSGRWEAAEKVSLAVCSDVRHKLAKMGMVRAFSEALPLTYASCASEAAHSYFDGYIAGACSAWASAGHEGEPPGISEEEENEELETGLGTASGRIEGASERFVGMLDKLRTTLAADVKAIWEAYATFCREELELDAQTLAVALMPPLLKELEGHAEDLEDVESDPEILEEYLEALRSAWQKTLPVKTKQRGERP